MNIELVVFILFYFILTLIWLVSRAELLDTCLFSQKTFEGIKTETWVRLEKYHKEYVVSRENKNQRDVVVADKSWCARLNWSSFFKDIDQRRELVVLVRSTYPHDE